MTITTTAGLSNSYITRAQRNRMVRATIAAILTTSEGAQLPKTQIARSAGCGVETVARMKNDMLALGLLGAVDAPAPATMGVPLPTFDDLQLRATDLAESIYVYDDVFSQVELMCMEAEARAIIALLEEHGSLRRHYREIVTRLEALEERLQ